MKTIKKWGKVTIDENSIKITDFHFKGVDGYEIINILDDSIRRLIEEREKRRNILLEKKLATISDLDIPADISKIISSNIKDMM